MGYLEEIVFSNKTVKPLIYGRYVDDIFIMYSTIEQLEEVKKSLENNSILKLTIEHSLDNKLSFLDILITKKQNKFHTEVYHKDTDIGQ